MNASLEMPPFSASRDYALDLDAADILAPYRKQFRAGPMGNHSFIYAGIRWASPRAPPSTG